MGVKGDKTRLSTVVAKQPFMGMIADQTSSWSEDVYSKAWSNTCWELYVLCMRMCVFAYVRALRVGLF